MKTIVAMACSAISLLLLPACTDQLASEAQKSAVQINAKATKIGNQKIDALKNESLEQLKKIGGQKKGETPDQKSGKKPDTSTDARAVPQSN